MSFNVFFSFVSTGEHVHWMLHLRFSSSDHVEGLCAILPWLCKYSWREGLLLCGVDFPFYFSDKGQMLCVGYGVVGVAAYTMFTWFRSVAMVGSALDPIIISRGIFGSFLPTYKMASRIVVTGFLFFKVCQWKWPFEIPLRGVGGGEPSASSTQI